MTDELLALLRALIAAEAAEQGKDERELWVEVRQVADYLQGVE